MKYKIGVLIVTYNRKEYLYELLENLSIQTEKIDTIFIVDNNSTDLTPDFLIDKKIINSYLTNEFTHNIWNNININYYKNDKNTGGSGGFSKGIKLILDSELEFDYLWIMDDDVLPKKDCLKILLKNVDNEHKVVIPNRSTGNFIDKPILSFNWTKVTKSITQKDYGTLNFDKTEVVDIPFEGPLISFDIVKKVGPSNDKYFILFDDSDYSQRCLKYTKIFFVRDAHLNRQILVNNNQYLFNWKNYYLIRNEIIFDKKYNSSKINPYFRSLFLLIRNILGSIKHRDKERFVYSIKAFVDGHLNKSGKTVEPGSF